MGRRRRQTNDDDPATEPDSVEQEFGNEYSEETLNILRGIDRPPYLEETSSLDPVEDLDLYVEHGLQIPPATYDALQELGDKDLEELQAVKDHVADAATQEQVRYRQQLAQGASRQDMTWLKLRAYHRAMDQLNAENQKDKAEFMDERMQAYDVPVDKVPANLLNLTPAQLAERQRLALLARSYAAKKAQKNKTAIQRILSRPDPSEESEWVTPQQQSSMLQQAARAGIMEAIAEHKGSLQLLPPPQEPSPVQEQQGQEEMAVQQHSMPRQREHRTVYTQAYLDQAALRKRVQQQQRQRTAAFWVSFAAVSVAYVTRLIRRRVFKGGKRAPPAKSQPRSSSATPVKQGIA